MHSNDSNERKSRELVLPKLSYELTGILYDIHNKLGRHLLEKQYADALEIALQESKVIYKREARVSIEYKGKNIPAGVADFIIDNKIALDLKAKKFITKDDYHKMLRYLKAERLHLGMIVNFRNTYLKPRRVLNNDFNT